MADVLREIGEPGEVARRFDPHPRYLVGPELYPLFALVGIGVEVFGIIRSQLRRARAV